MAGKPKPDVGQLEALIAELPEELREQALTHASWVEDQGDAYTRLAYLGDSVLGLAIAAELHRRYPDVDAGGLTQVHNQVVSGVSCNEVGRELGIPEMLKTAKPENEEAVLVETLLSGARPVPEMTEALIGACFLSHGFDRTSAAVAAAFAHRIELAAKSPRDPKSALQELLARRKARVSYEVIEESGSAHRRTFQVAAVVDSERVGEGEGRSKKAAEQAAAEQALERLGG